ncbi:hypothetical protein J6590_022657 [Homalodisca vitripennis]|nr:hypothetical protein J6590_022657 [Homalodisca vitripennis]
MTNMVGNHNVYAIIARPLSPHSNPVLSQTERVNRVAKSRRRFPSPSPYHSPIQCLRTTRSRRRLRAPQLPLHVLCSVAPASTSVLLLWDRIKWFYFEFIDVL